MMRKEDARWPQLQRADETHRATGISDIRVQPSPESWKQDPGIYGLVLEIAATPTADLCEQIRLLEGVDWYAATRRRRLALSEVARRMTVPR